MQNMKRYKLDCHDDYIFYLMEILIDVTQYKKRLTFYHSEIGSILDSNPDSKIIESTFYESISDKIRSVLFYLFNIIGDETKNTVSYRRFRKILYKNQGNLGIVISRLPEDTLSILKSFNQYRNWGLHIPESLLIGKRKLFKIDSEFINTLKLNIPLPTYQYYEIKFLQCLFDEVESVLTSVQHVEEYIMQDYKALVGKEFSMYPDIQQVKPYGIMKAVQTSLDIQTGRQKQ